MNIHTYQSASGRDLIREYIDTLTELEQIDALSVLECMEKNEFNKIQFKKWYKSVYEVYFQKHNPEKKDKNIVIKRAKELGKALGKKFI